MSGTSSVTTRQWWMAGAAGMASYLDAGLIVVVGLSLPVWKQDLGLEPIQVGVIGGALTLAMAVGALAGGRLADVVGRQRMFTADRVAFLAGTLMVASTSDYAVILIGVVLAGLAAGADLPTSVAVVSERAPAEVRGRLVAFTQLFWSLGIGGSMVLGFAFSALGPLGVRLTWAHLVLLCAVTLVVRRHPSVRAPARRPEDGHSPPAAERALPWRELLASPVWRRSLVLTGLFYLAWLPTASTIGQFKIYLLVTAGGASQSLATGLGFVTAVIAIGMLSSLLSMQRVMVVEPAVVFQG